MAFITVENLRYRYPHADRLALDGLSFCVEKGEFIGIIGENGAGKSTLSQALIGLVPQFYKGAYGGTVLVDGLEAGKTPVSEMCRKVGLVFQNPFNQLSGARDTVYEEVAFGMQNLGVERDEMRRRVREALKLLDIWQYRDRNPFDLSGGQMQRVAIASILVMQPEVILLDEPTSQLDPAGSEEVFAAVDSLTRSGITIFMIEQKIEKLAAYCDRILLLKEGRQIAFDTPRKIFSLENLEEMGVQPPAFTRICRDLGKALPDGSWPVTEDEAAGLLREMRIRPLLQERIPGQPGCKTGQGKGQAADLETPGTEPLFKIRQLGFSYTPGVPILDGLNLELDARPTAVIGQNGAGKTTLVKLLKGLLRPVSGTIFFGQEDTSQKTVAMLAGKIGYVFQNPDDQIFKYNVLDEVMFGPQNIGMSPEKAKAEARKALETVGLWDKAGENPYDLELGERKMVAIASVLAMDTDVVILDEPTIAQDFAGRSVIAGAIRELKKRGKLVLAILHDMDFVAECFERVIVMAHGAILADGDAGTVFAMDDVLQKARLQKPSVARLCRRLSGETGELRVCLTVEEFLQRNGGTDLLEKP